MGKGIGGTDFAPSSFFYFYLFLVAFVGSIVAIVSAAVGFLGIFRENRSLLTIYTTMLWAVFALYVAVGYIAFRREKNHLNQRLRDEWIHNYTRDQRLLVQRQVKKDKKRWTLNFHPLLLLHHCRV